MPSAHSWLTSASRSKPKWAPAYPSRCFSTSFLLCHLVPFAYLLSDSCSLFFRRIVGDTAPQPWACTSLTTCFLVGPSTCADSKKSTNSMLCHHPMDFHSSRRTSTKVPRCFRGSEWRVSSVLPSRTPITAVRQFFFRLAPRVPLTLSANRSRARDTSTGRSQLASISDQLAQVRCDIYHKIHGLRL